MKDLILQLKDKIVQSIYFADYEFKDFYYFYSTKRYKLKIDGKGLEIKYAPELDTITFIGLTDVSDLLTEIDKKQIITQLSHHENND